MRSRPGDPDRHKKCTGPAERRVTALSTTGRYSTDPVHDPRGPGRRGTVVPCETHLTRTDRGSGPGAAAHRAVSGAAGRGAWRGRCRRRPPRRFSRRGGGAGRRPPRTGRPRPRPRPHPPLSPPRWIHRPIADGSGHWPGGPWSYGDGSRPPRTTGRGTAGWTSPPGRVRRCSRPLPAGSRSRAPSRDGECWRSSWRGRAIRRCGRRTSRCARWSRRGTRSPRGRWWRSWLRGRSTALPAVCTGGCAARRRIWTRCHCCRPRCCGAGRPGCCRWPVCPN